MSMIKARLQQSNRRCDKCRRARGHVYLVREGPTTGTFCSRRCYELARSDMEKANPPQNHNG